MSHDFRLIDQVALTLTLAPNPNQVAKEIWVCEKKGVRKYGGSSNPTPPHTHT